MKKQKEQFAKIAKMVKTMTIELGAKVIVLSLKDTSSKYPSDLVGAEGIVKELFKDRVGISIPGYDNCMSEKNYFWFPKENVKEKKGNIEMEKNVKVYVLAEVNDIDDTSIGVAYEELNENDIVVCDYDYHNGKLSVRKVVRLFDGPTIHRIDCKILGVADCRTYFERKERMARRAELKKQMIEQAKKYQEEEYWRVISETDPAMKALYEEFKKLGD